MDVDGPPADPSKQRSLVLEDAEGLEHGVHEGQQEEEQGEEVWEDQEVPEDVKDIQFLVFWLSRRNKIHDRHRGLIVQCVFLVFCTIALMQHCHDGGYRLVKGVGDVVGGGEWDQGEATGLFFEKTFADVQEVEDWWAWVKSGESMQALYGKDNVTYQGQNRILPNIIRFSQRRVRSVRGACSDTNTMLDARFSDYFSGCWPAYSYSDENTRGFVEGVTYDFECPRENVTQPWPCGCDALMRSGFSHKQQKVDGFGVSVPSIVRGIPDWQGRFATYSTHSYYFDTYADHSVEEYLAKMDCLEAQEWIDPSTRQVEISWFTYNPPSNLFVHHRMSAEITSEGLFYAKAVVSPFRWFILKADINVVSDIITFAFVVCYTLHLLYSIVHYIATTGRVVMWVFSVWRVFDVINFSFFIYVYVYKIAFMSIGEVTLILPENEADIPHDLTDHELWTEELKEHHYNSEAYALLLGYTSNYNLLVRMTAVNALLSWIRLFKFVSLSPRLNLLSETIKEAAGDLLALVIYIFLITHAFALCGMLLFSSQLLGFSSYSHSMTTLLRMLVGDFDYDAMLEVTLLVQSYFTLVLFWGYIFMVWLLLLNMIISIISDGFAAAKRRQDIAIGSATAGTQLRYIGRIAEEFVRHIICRSRLKVKRDDPDGPITVRVTTLAIKGVCMDKICQVITDLRNESVRSDDCTRSWPQDHILTKMGYKFPCVHKSVMADRLRALCSEETADYVARALCWYLDVRCNGTRGSVYYSRVQYEEVWKEAMMQTSDGYRKEYLDSLDENGDREEVAQQQCPFTELRNEVTTMLRESEMRVINEIRRSTGQDELVPDYPPPPSDTVRSPLRVDSGSLLSRYRQPYGHRVDAHVHGHVDPHVHSRTQLAMLVDPGCE